MLSPSPSLQANTPHPVVLLAEAAKADINRVSPTTPGTHNDWVPRSSGVDLSSRRRLGVGELHRHGGCIRAESGGAAEAPLMPSRNVVSQLPSVVAPALRLRLVPKVSFRA